MIDYSIYVTRLTGVRDIILHQRYEDVTVAAWRKATEAVDQFRPRLTHEFLHVDSRDLAVGGVFLTISRR